MADIQSGTAEITRGKEEDRRQKPQSNNSCPALFHRTAIIMTVMVIGLVAMENFNQLIERL